MDKKLKNLISYCQGIYNKEDGQLLYQQYLSEIKTITPEELIILQNEQLKILQPSEMLTFVDKLMNVFYDSLSKYRLENDLPLFIQTLIDENDALEMILDGFKEKMKDIKNITTQELEYFIKQLELYHVHFEKLENMLFSNLEKIEAHFSGLSIMWALHDEIRRLTKSIRETLSEKNPSEMVVEIGRLYFLMYGAIQKQNLVLFPVALNKLEAEIMLQMYDESFEYGFCYIDTPKRTEVRKGVSQMIDQLIKTEQGSLELDTLIGILNLLPVDFTLVDENDEVKFFNDPPNRIFPRSKSVIGRNVRNCHPPQSVHIVEEILESFKTGKKDKAEFWIKMKGMMIYIYYIPLVMDGVYKGTLEISQEISELRALEGERRLLDWSN